MSFASFRKFLRLVVVCFLSLEPHYFPPGGKGGKASHWRKLMYYASSVFHQSDRGKGTIKHKQHYDF